MFQNLPLNVKKPYQQFMYSNIIFLAVQQAFKLSSFKVTLLLIWYKEWVESAQIVSELLFGQSFEKKNVNKLEWLYYK